MWCGSGCWNTDSKRHLSLELNSFLESLKYRSCVNFEDRSVKDVSILQNFCDFHFILERINLQFIEKSGLGTINSGVLENNLFSSNNINLTFDNFRLNLQVLEEFCLSWVKTCWTNFYPHIFWSKHTWFSRRLSNFQIKAFFDITQIAIWENQVDVTSKMIDDLFNFWAELPVIFSFFVVNIPFLWLCVCMSKSSFHEGVFTHNHVGINLS